MTRVESPLLEALRALTGEEPPGFVVGVYDCDDLEDERVEELQEWCSLNARPEWSTGVGVLEAAEAIVREAEANANIPRRSKP